MYHPKPKSLAQTIDVISASRLSNYKAFFKPNDDHELYGLYCWNDAVSSCFMRLIGIVEISLRNRFHSALSQELWVAGTSVGTQDSNDWYNHLNLPQKSFEKIQEITHDITWPGGVKKIKPKPRQPNCNQVISSMTYGFWPKLLDVTNIDWGVILPNVFRGHHQTSDIYWRRLVSQDSIYARLVLIGNLRNRVAHFEPLWKLKDLNEEKRQRSGITINVVRAAPTNAIEAIEYLKILHRNISQLLHWLSKERALDYAECEINTRLQFLLTENALDQFKKSTTYKSVRLGSMTKSWGGKLSFKEGTPLLVHHKKKVAGIFYPTL